MSDLRCEVHHSRMSDFYERAKYDLSQSSCFASPVLAYSLPDGTFILSCGALPAYSSRFPSVGRDVTVRRVSLSEAVVSRIMTE